MTDQQARRINTRKLKNPVWPTVLMMMIGCYLGFAALPSTVFGVVLVPLYAAIGGRFFAGRLSGSTGAMARRMGVTAFPAHHEITNRVQEMAKQLNLPPIAHVGEYPSDELNAFACGTRQDQAMIAFSSGLVSTLNKEQFDAVIGHELAHVANKDMVKMTYARGVQEALTFFLIFNGAKRLIRWTFTTGSEIYVMMFSRKREFYADAIGAVLSSPQAMISALQILDGQAERERKYPSQYQNMMIFGAFGDLFATHPSTQKRIDALQQAKYINKLPMT